MNVLVLNCGSSSLKFQIIDVRSDSVGGDEQLTLAKGLVERIGSHALLTLEAKGKAAAKLAEPLRDHRSAIERVLRWVVSPDSGIESIRSLAEIHAVGHRVVHGGERFMKSALIDDEVMRGIEDCIELAPLHNPANLKGVRCAAELLGEGIPQVAVFDTSFHSRMPETSYLYGLPYQFYRRHKIRRYGFHGTSHRYVSYRYRRLKEIERDDVNIITLHLGNGCSACAIKSGRSFNTSMGFTPLEGLLMGTRVGDLDPTVIDYIAHKEGLTPSEINTVLNKQSGLLGISGLTSDMRELIEEESEHDDRRAKLAIAIFCQRVKHYIGGYLAEMGGAQAVVFTGGIGENSADIRGRIATGMEGVGLEFDEGRNSEIAPGMIGAFHREGSRVEAWVIPTNEELLIAIDTFRVIQPADDSSGS